MDPDTSHVPSNWIPDDDTRVRVLNSDDGTPIVNGPTGIVRPDDEAHFEPGNTNRPCVWVVFDRPLPETDPPVTGCWYPTYRLVPVDRFQLGDRVNRASVDLPGVGGGVVIGPETLCVEVQDLEGARARRFIPTAVLERVAPPTFEIGDRVNRSDGSRCSLFGYVLGNRADGTAVWVGWSNGDTQWYNPHDLIRVEEGQPLTLEARIAAGSNR